MASSTYLELTNRVLNALNEVELTSVTFTTTTGFHTEAKNAINQGLFDIYSYENAKWPFLFSIQTLTVPRGAYNFSQPFLATDIDWNSFHINRPSFIVTITQTGGLATATTNIPHNAVTGDLFYIDNANEIGYNKSNQTITVTGASTFTYPVASSTVSPATGTITAKSNTIQWKRLAPIDINEYRLSYAKQYENLNSDNFDIPHSVVRDQDNEITILPAPHRYYTISYDAFTVPSRMVNYSDTHLIPENYEQAIVDFALHYAYMFRDNSDEAQLATKRAEDRVRRMRKALIPVQTDVNWG